MVSTSQPVQMLTKKSAKSQAAPSVLQKQRLSQFAVIVVVAMLHVAVGYNLQLDTLSKPVPVPLKPIEVRILKQPLPPVIPKPVIQKPVVPPKIEPKPVLPKPKPIEEKVTPQKPAPEKSKVAEITKASKAHDKAKNAEPIKTQIPITNVPTAVQTPTETVTDKMPVPESAPINKPSSKTTETNKPAITGHSHTAASTEARSGCAAPVYPKDSELNGDEGTTTLALLIAEDGRVVDAKIERSSGFAELDRAAKKALVLCTFQPATSNGKPEKSWSKLSWKWQLGN